MQNDEVIWQVLRHKHCSYMAKITPEIFCRNPYNLTGVCNRSSCPLANSRYATICEDEGGVFYLYMKTTERAHMPNKLWERAKLPQNYEKALEVIDKHLAYWPKFLVHKAKQRLTKMTQMWIRMRKLKLKTREKIVTVPTKEKKREARREGKAETAAKLSQSIANELIARLNKGIYPNGLDNFHPDKCAIVFPENEDELEQVEYVIDDFGELEEEEDMEDFSGLPTEVTASDDDNVAMDEDDDMEAVEVAIHGKRWRKDSKHASKKAEMNAKKKKARVLVEVEHEDTDKRQKATV